MIVKPQMAQERARSSRLRYRAFREDYRHRRLDDDESSGSKPVVAGQPEVQPPGSGAAIDKPADRKAVRRRYLREYMRWLWPYRGAVLAFAALALATAGLQMIEPLFMRFIVDRVLLVPGLDTATKLTRLNTAGALFLVLVVGSNLLNVIKDYRQKLLNVRVMLSLRQSLFERLVHLPLSKLYDMKTGGILSRLTGDVDTTTGLLQMAIVSPSISVVRLVIAVGDSLHPELASGPDGARDHSRRDADELHVRQARAAHLSIAAQGRGAHRRPRRRDVRRHPRRACVWPRSA